MTACWCEWAGEGKSGPHVDGAGLCDCDCWLTSVYLMFALAGPRLGSGPVWDLRGRGAAREKVKREEVDKELEGHGDLVKTLEYMKQLEREIASMRAGSDARGIKMLGQALSGSDDADVQFVFEGGQATGVRGHRGMLCAGSEEYAGMFRSGMAEAQEGKICLPPGVGVGALRGLLEWVYLGE